MNSPYLMSATFLIPWQKLPEYVYVNVAEAPNILLRHEYVVPTQDSFHLIDYEAEIVHGGSRRSLQPGDWIFTQRGAPFLYRKIGPGRHLYFHFRYPPARKMDEAKPLPRTGNLGGYFTELWQEGLTLISDSQGSRVLQQRCAGLGFHRILLKLCLLIEEKQLQGGAKISRAERIGVEVARRLQTYPGSAISVAQLAEEFQISQNHLARSFRERYRMSIGQFHLKCQMEHAEYLILQTTMPFKAIANEIGCTDAHHFNKRVRQYFRLSPTQIRARARS